VTQADWKQRAIDLRTRLDQFEARLDRLHRSILDKEVLRRTVPLRARTLPARSAQPDARAREQRLRDGSAPYAEAVAGDLSLARDARRTTVDGLTWWVPLTRPDDPMLVERAIAHQDFSYRVILQTRELALGDAMIDIGANVGRMSIPRVVLGDVRIAYCAEPDPLNYACLVQNVRDNHLGGLVLPDRLAIGATSGTVRFSRGRFAGGHRVVGPGETGQHEVIDVPMLTLDEWVSRMRIDLDEVTFVKVDVQGSEVAVLRGAAGVLARRHIAWQIEVDPHLLRAGGASAGELFSLLQRGFTHFIDLSKHLTGARVRPIAELGEALAYVCGPPEGRTDVLVCTLDET
jgi:FkbM family methyltransferase